MMNETITNFTPEIVSGYLGIFLLILWLCLISAPFRISLITQMYKSNKVKKKKDTNYSLKPKIKIIIKITIKSILSFFLEIFSLLLAFTLFLWNIHLLLLSIILTIVVIIVEFYLTSFTIKNEYKRYIDILLISIGIFITFWLICSGIYYFNY